MEFGSINEEPTAVGADLNTKYVGFTDYNPCLQKFFCCGNICLQFACTSAGNSCKKGCLCIHLLQDMSTVDKCVLGIHFLSNNQGQHIIFIFAK